MTSSLTKSIIRIQRENHLTMFKFRKAKIEIAKTMQRLLETKKESNLLNRQHLAHLEQIEQLKIDFAEEQNRADIAEYALGLGTQSKNISVEKIVDFCLRFIKNKQDAELILERVVNLLSLEAVKLRGVLKSKKHGF